MVYQDLSLCDTIDVAGNLYLGRELRRGPFLDKAAMQRGAREMLKRLEIRIPNRRGQSRATVGRAAAVDRHRALGFVSIRAC